MTRDKAVILLASSCLALTAAVACGSSKRPGLVGGSGGATGSGGASGPDGGGGDAAGPADGGAGGAGVGTGGGMVTPPLGSGGGPGGGGSGGGSGGAGAISLPPRLDAPPVAEDAGPLAVRRLTARELRTTVIDLLGPSPGVTAALAKLGGDPISASGFRAPRARFSQQETDQLFEVSHEMAEAAMEAGTISVPCVDPNIDGTPGCTLDFVRAFGRRAFRRPLTRAEEDDLLALHAALIDQGVGFRRGLAYVVAAMLQSPSFLYHWEIGEAVPAREGGLIALSQHQVASRLSYLLWGTLPDEALLVAADAGELATPAQVLAHARRMLADPARSPRGLIDFHEQWLRLDEWATLQKDAGRHPAFTPAVRDALRVELATYVPAVLSGTGDGTLRTLLTAPHTYANTALAPLYGAALPPGSAETPVLLMLDPRQRAGVLTQVGFLATHATPRTADPMRRGHLVWQQILCGTPSAAHGPMSPPEDPALTSRERLSGNRAAACASCHGAFDPLGFAFEGYDAVGSYRTTENGKAIEASGEVVTPGGSRIAFRDAVELVNALAGSDEVKWCVTRQWFRYWLGRPDTVAERGSMEAAYRAGAAVPGHSIRELLMAAVQTRSFRYRAPSAGEP